MSDATPDSPQIVTRTTTITLDDIRTGKQCNPWHCPTAKAVRRLVSPKVGIGVGRTLVSYRYGPHWTPYPLEVSAPKSLRDSVANFDLGLLTEPTEIEVSIPEECLR